MRERRQFEEDLGAAQLKKWIKTCHLVPYHDSITQPLFVLQFDFITQLKYFDVTILILYISLSASKSSFWNCIIWLHSCTSTPTSFGGSKSLAPSPNLFSLVFRLFVFNVAREELSPHGFDPQNFHPAYSRLRLSADPSRNAAGVVFLLQVHNWDPQTLF